LFRLSASTKAQAGAYTATVSATSGLTRQQIPISSTCSSHTATTR
jgi:hypothetical protein